MKNRYDGFVLAMLILTYGIIGAVTITAYADWMTS